MQGFKSSCPRYLGGLQDNLIISLWSSIFCCPKIRNRSRIYLTVTRPPVFAYAPVPHLWLVTDDNDHGSLQSQSHLRRIHPVRSLSLADSTSIPHSSKSSNYLFLLSTFKMIRICPRSSQNVDHRLPRLSIKHLHIKHSHIKYLQIEHL